MQNAKYQRQAARLLSLCISGGQLDPRAVRAVARRLADPTVRHARQRLQALVETVRRATAMASARVTSPMPLGEAEQVETRRRIADLAPAVRDIEFVVDPSLVAGLRIQIGWDVYDGSVRGRLERLERSLTADVLGHGGARKPGHGTPRGPAPVGLPTVSL